MLAIFGVISSSQADLQFNFYAKTCPKAEKIVQDYVHVHIPNAPSLAATLIRMHFHDCFVRASVKILPPFLYNAALRKLRLLYAFCDHFIASTGL